MFGLQTNMLPIFGHGMGGGKVSVDHTHCELASVFCCTTSMIAVPKRELKNDRCSLITFRGLVQCQVKYGATGPLA